MPSPILYGVYIRKEESVGEGGYIAQWSCNSNGEGWVVGGGGGGTHNKASKWNTIL